MQSADHELLGRRGQPGAEERDVPLLEYRDVNSNLELHAVHPTRYHMISHDIMSPDHSPSPQNTNCDITIYHMIS